MHRVVGKILQWCIPCYDRKVAEIQARKAEPPAPEQGKLAFLKGESHDR